VTIVLTAFHFWVPVAVLIAVCSFCGSFTEFPLEAHGIRTGVSEFKQQFKTRRARASCKCSAFFPGHSWRWLGAAEAPTKLVSIGVSPMVISLIMVVGVFSGALSLPALILGTSSVRADVRRAPHLIILGAPRRLSLGGGEHADHLRHSRHWF